MRPITYTLLGSARVRHGYFADGLARSLRFTPDAQTWRALTAHRLLLRCNGHGLAVHADALALERLWIERAPRALRFSLDCADPAFALYTEPGELPALSLPLFEADDGEEETVWRARLGGAVELDLPARRTVWKYLLLGDWREHRPELVDAGAAVQFEPPSEERLPDGRLALVIRSRSALALAEQSPHRFQLRDAASQPPKLLRQRLPAAAPRGLQREPSPQGGHIAVTEIFVSR
ncbi:hypothetical protein G8A07_11045 [Roseateles sp. DAIF2]|uniref:hypothetical protein n=1 Tax=Roseateles sp. DAIF2 TaxID=2714952 RepID=UPI0018A275F4|nr:hypothetical protein [Roseateles sp. DAIF2]QPF73401.1 hypothetical protein G8A07_11045 [Roseateles sp. DAIF2]